MRGPDDVRVVLEGSSEVTCSLNWTAVTIWYLSVAVALIAWSAWLARGIFYEKHKEWW
jgi:hypothetical protein